MKNFDSSKPAQESHIATKIIKNKIDIFVPILYKEFNKSIKTGKFPSAMKSGDVTPVFTCQRLREMYFDVTPSKYQSGFRKGFHPQHYLSF